MDNNPRLEFGILGPLFVRGDNGPLPVAGARRRALLVRLLVSANRPVPTERLVHDLWGNRAALVSISALQSHVSALRQALGPGRLSSRNGGYVVDVADDEFDVWLFESDAARGRSLLAAGDVAPALSLLNAALGRWRGPALVDGAGAAWAQSEAARLEGLRADVVEASLEASLDLGQHSSVAATAQAEIARYPWRERLWADLMLALYRSGRQAEALRAFHRLRQQLGEELGIEPSPELVALEEAILLHKPELEWQPLTGQARPETQTAPPDAQSRGGAGLPGGTVTFLFSDIEGSTAMLRRLGPGYSAVLDRHRDLLREAVWAEGGVTVNTEGDGSLFAFAGAGAALAASVNATLALAAEAWPDDEVVRVRMGLHTGEAWPHNDDYTALAVHQGARVAAAAHGGQILVSEATVIAAAEALPAGVSTADVGPFRLKDFDIPVRLFQLHHSDLAGDFPVPRAKTAAASNLPAALEGPSLAAVSRLPLPPQLKMSRAGFFGRSGERAAIDAALDAALEGRRQVVFVAGEAGIGKTRLATEVAVGAYARGVNVVYGRCDEDLGLPYQPFVEALTYTVRHCPEAALREIIGGSPSQLVRLVPELAICLPGTTAPTAADPDTERYWLFDAVAGWLAAMSTVTPLVLVLDDLHWATTPTLLMLRQLVRSQDMTRLLIVGLYRDSELGSGHPLTGILADLHREPNMRRVALGGLDVTSVAGLIGEASHQALDDAGAELATALQTGTGGNPFFVGEILRSLVETDALGRREGRRASALTIDKFALPESVREVVEGRLARLSGAANRMLAAAAVAGPSFSLALLENVPDAADDAAALIDTLDEAVEAAILVDTGSQADGYNFAHAVIRQVAYGRLSAARRARLHQQIGEALERIPGSEGARLSGLAYHFAEAARTPNVDKAVDYALRAGRHALSQLAFEEAITYLERGLRMFELAEHPGGMRRAELLLVLAEARFQVLDRAGVKQAAIEVAEIARAVDSPELLARAAIACRFIAWFGQLDRDIVAICEEALAALDPDDSGLRSQVLATLVVHRAAGGEGWQTETLALEAVDLARRANSPETLAIALWARWNALAGSERAAEELPLAEELIRLASAAGSAVFEFSGHHWRGACRLALGDIAGFDEDRVALARLGERTHSADIVAHCQIWQASRALLDGRFEDAERHMADLLAHAGGDQNFLNGYAALLMWLRFEQGRLADFKDMALAYIGLYPEWAVLRAALSVLRLELAELAEAKSAFEGVADDLCNVPRDFTWPATLALLAEFAARTGSDLASDLYELLYPYHGQLLAVGNGGACIGAADRYLGMLAMTAGRKPLAQQHYETALRFEQGIGSIPLSTRTRYWQARLLSGSDSPTDRQRSRVLLDDVIEAATGLGMESLADQAAKARAGVEEPPETS